MKKLNITNELEAVRKAIEESKELTNKLELIEFQLEMMKSENFEKELSDIQREVRTERIKKNLVYVKATLKYIKKILDL